MLKRLTEVKVGETVRVVDIEGGEGAKMKLMRLGIIPGTELTVENNNFGPILIKVRETRIAIGRGISEKIIVETIAK